MANKKKVWGYKSIHDGKGPQGQSKKPSVSSTKTPNYPNTDNKYKNTKGGKK